MSINRSPTFGPRDTVFANPAMRPMNVSCIHVCVTQGSVEPTLHIMIKAYKHFLVDNNLL